MTHEQTAMATERMTFTVPSEVKRRAQARRDVNWSAVVTSAIERKLAAIELGDRLASRSELTPEDVAELADVIDGAMAEHFGVDD